MPQVGWKDPANGQEKPFEQWLEEARVHGSALGLPYEVLLGMRKQLDKSDRPDGFSATMLSKCARAVWLDRDAEYYADPQSNYAAFRGTIGHSILEANQHPSAIVERRVFRMYRGEALSGQLDKVRLNIPGEHSSAAEAEYLKLWLDYCDSMFAFEMAEAAGLGEDAEPPVAPEMPEGAVFEIEDWKTKDKVPFGIYVFDHHKKQGNTYRWLLRIPVEAVQITFVYVSMTEVKPLQVYNGGKFANGRARPMQVMSDEEFEAYLDDRLRNLALQKKLGRPLPYAKVPTDDLWECNWCPVKDLCYSEAAKEARAEWEKGKDVDRMPPRSKDEEQKVSLPKPKKEPKPKAAPKRPAKKTDDLPF